MWCPDPLDAPLPRRPRLVLGRAELWRDPGTVQLGLDPCHALVVEQLSPPLARLIHDLDGRRTVPELLADLVADGCPAEDTAGLLRELHRAGMLDDAALGAGPSATAHHSRLVAEVGIWSTHTGQLPAVLLRARQRASVVVHGSGRLGAAVGVLLATAGIGRVHVAATGRVRPADVGFGYPAAAVGRSRAAAAAEAMRAVAPDVVTTPPAPRHRPDLVVLADAAAHEPGAATELVRRGTPHLAVRVRESVAVVGPLVVPGRSSCLRCAELHRAGVDAAWPKLAAQLATSPPHAELVTAAAAASLASSQVLAALAGPGTPLGVPPVWSATLEFDPVNGRLQRRPWPVHPECGCAGRADGPGAADDRADKGESGSDRHPEENGAAHGEAREPAPRGGRPSGGGMGQAARRR